MHQLVNKQLVRDDQVTLADGKIDIHYSFEPLYQKAITLLLHAKQQENKEPASDFNVLTELFEQEFGRSLTPMQLTMIHDWIKVDGYSQELIVAALKEAVLANVRHLNYIRSILDNWKQKGILTVQEAEVESQKYRKQKQAVMCESIDKNMFSDSTINWFR
nr:DnaD domain protein [Granulicatella sp. 19428wC4_WM01]